MSTRHTMKSCKACGKPTLHVQPGTSHVLHLLLAVFSFGLWLPVWILVTLNNPTKAQCTICGRDKGVFG